MRDAALLLVTLAVTLLGAAAADLKIPASHRAHAVLARSVPS